MASEARPTQSAGALVDAHARYLERIALYRSFGYDRPASVRFAVDRLGPFEGAVLDVGTGRGLLAIELARRGNPVTSIDVSHDEQRIGIDNVTYEGLADRVTFLTCDARNTPFGDAAFGAIATVDALHHFDDGPGIFREMLRVLAPGGRILLADLTPAGFALVARVHESEGRVHPVGPVTAAAAVDWFASNGFRLLSLEEGHLHAVAVLEKG